MYVNLNPRWTSPNLEAAAEPGYVYELWSSDAPHMVYVGKTMRPAVRAKEHEAGILQAMKGETLEDRDVKKAYAFLAGYPPETLRFAVMLEVPEDELSMFEQLAIAYRNSFIIGLNAVAGSSSTNGPARKRAKTDATPAPTPGEAMDLAFMVWQASAGWPSMWGDKNKLFTDYKSWHNNDPRYKKLSKADFETRIAKDEIKPRHYLDREKQTDVLADATAFVKEALPDTSIPGTRVNAKLVWSALDRFNETNVYIGGTQRVETYEIDNGWKCIDDPWPGYYEF
jgi:hypothetical protein